MNVNIKILPVYQGDAILLFFRDGKKSILVDTGTRRSYTKGVLKNEIKILQSVDLLILTHPDEDHIGGVLKYFEDKKRINSVFKSVWFNAGLLIHDELNIGKKNIQNVTISDSDDLEMSIKQGITLEGLLKDENIWHDRLIKAGDNYNLNFCNILILSPEIEDLKVFYGAWEVEIGKQMEMAATNDYHQSIADLIKIKFVENGTIANKSSIAFMIEVDNSKMLLMGDAFPSVIETNIRKLGYNEKKKLNLNIVKVSHHGSGSSISPSLLNIIDCKKFIISTNGSNGLPSKECLARIITHREERICLYFNYKNEITENIFFEQEFQEYNFEVIYLNEENNYTIPISE